MTYRHEPIYRVQRMRPDRGYATVGSYNYRHEAESEMNRQRYVYRQPCRVVRNATGEVVAEAR